MKNASIRVNVEKQIPNVGLRLFSGLVVVLEHLKIKTKLTNEKFASVKGECEI
jgi:hypothetical protein